MPLFFTVDGLFPFSSTFTIKGIRIVRAAVVFLDKAQHFLYFLHLHVLLLLSIIPHTCFFSVNPSIDQPIGLIHSNFPCVLRLTPCHPILLLQFNSIHPSLPPFPPSFLHSLPPAFRPPHPHPFAAQSAPSKTIYPITITISQSAGIPFFLPLHILPPPPYLS
ncbi:hypothetical protein BDR22DRAFT_289666 [Usnea florida]